MYNNAMLINNVKGIIHNHLSTQAKDMVLGNANGDL